MPEQWKQTDVEVVHDGDRPVERRRYRRGDGQEQGFDVTVEGEGACVLAVTPEQNVVLVRQFRPGPGKVLWDLPGGYLEPGEEPEQAAARELAEESGYAGELRRITTLHPHPYSDERRHVFISERSRRTVEPEPDEGEELEVVEVTIGELLARLRAGEVVSTDAAYAALHAAGFLSPTDATNGLGDLLGLRVTDTGDGTSLVELTAGERHLNRHGTVHGGAIATLADAAMGAAIASDGGSPVTIEMTVTYLEPGQPGHLRAEGSVQKRGKRIAIAEADITDESGELIARAVATFTPG